MKKVPFKSSSDLVW